MRAAVVALALVGCAPVGLAPETPAGVGVCETPCGMKGPDVRCDELIVAEGQAIRAFDRYVDLWTAVNACAGVNGWAVRIHRADPGPCRGLGWWSQTNEECVSGLAVVTEHTLYVLGADWMHSSLAHEMVHAIDFTTTGRATHCRWRERGVKAALREATGEEDPSPPDRDCNDSK